MLRGHEYNIGDSAVYYFENVERISLCDVPTSQDILRSRYRTTGVIESHFEAQGSRFKIIDVGGQRGERKKWVSFFDEVTAVIFVAAISEYDQMLTEDMTVNRMHETLELFKRICDLKVFENTSIILFLNKDDIFREKIQTVPLNMCFPKFQGGNTYKECAEYILRQFQARKSNPDRDIYPHFTCATDTGSFHKVLLAVQDIILTKALQDVHL